MNGILWTGSGGDIKTEMRLAINHYRTKFRAQPTICWVSPSDYSDGLEELGISIDQHQDIEPGTLWLGVSENTVIIGQKS